MLTSTHHHNRAAKRHPVTHAQQHVGQELPTCDFAWEFGWSCHGRHWTGPAENERHGSTLPAALDRALAFAG